MWVDNLSERNYKLEAVKLKIKQIKIEERKKEEEEKETEIGNRKIKRVFN